MEGRVREMGRKMKEASPDSVTFQPSAGCCVYLLLSTAEIRSEVMAAVVCYPCYNKGIRDDLHLGQQDEPLGVSSSCEKRA